LPSGSLFSGSLRPALAGYCCSIAALLVFFACSSPRNAIADSETRTISFHHIHTHEDLTVTYKVNGRYNEEALAKINHFMRDWRESEPIKMDPHLIDLLWEVHREVGAKESIWIVCGYRSPTTNSALRRRSSGVAQHSQHTLGKAIDFYIPGVPLDQLRAAGLRAQRGGVGFYPTSGAPFVHMDTGSVRHWPRMPEEQLATVMAKGPLRYGSSTQVAQAEAPQRGSNPIALLAKLFGGGKDEEEDAATAAAPAPAPKVAAARMATRPAAKPAKPETNKPETYQVADAGSTLVVKPADKPAQIFELSSATSQPAPAPGGFGLASTTSKPAIVRPASAASLVAQANIPANDVVSANDIINQRGYWQGLPSAADADAPQANAAARPAPAPSPAPRRATALASEASGQRGNSIVRAPDTRPEPGSSARAAVASAEPATTSSVRPSWPLADPTDNEPLPNALAYAAQPTPIAAARALPMGSGTTPRAATPPETTVVVKRSDERPAATPAAPAPAAAAPKPPNVVRVGDRFNDPWLRAMIVSPSAQSYMKTTLLGLPDFRNLGPFMQKPATTVLMTFSENPHLGMTTDKFAGSAVVFTPTVTFNAPRTAALK
jgi:uncharacterized protein YcbK (DUF882 family)